MKIKILSLCAFVVILFAQFHVLGQVPFMPEQHQVKLSPGSAAAPKVNILGQSNSSATLHSRAVTCDTTFLDPSFYNYVYALENNLYTNGFSADSLFGAQLTSFVDQAHNNDFTFIQAVFDTLAYVDQYYNFGYYPLATNTVTIDSVGFYIGISGSPLNMQNDSLLVGVYYLLDGFYPLLLNTIVYQGYNQLQAFIQPTNSVAFKTIPVNQLIPEGEGFAISLTYIDKSPSTVCLFTYSYADSCYTVSLNDTLYNSPADVNPLGLTSYVDVISEGTVYEEDNESYYNIPNIPISCLFIQEQNLGIYPFVSICPDASITPPVVITSAASNITQNGATINGTVNANGNQDTVSFYWGMDMGADTGFRNYIAASPLSVNGNITTPISAALTGLLPYTTYHYVAASFYNGTTTYGQPVTFTTVGNLAVAINKTDVSCYNDSNGMAIAVATQGSGYSYSWSNHQTTDTITGLAPGPYSVTVSANGQTATASVNISQPSAPLAIVPTITNVNCDGGNTGSISVSLTGGTSPYYYYHWSNIQANVTTDDTLAVGTYQITATDSRLCTVSGSYNISQNPSTDISVSSTGSTGSNGTATATVTGGVPPYTYSWNSEPVQSDSTATGLAPGGYSVTATDSKNCTAAASVTVASLAGIIEAGNEITNVTLFPNPASEMIQVIVELESAHTVGMNVTDVTGKLVYTLHSDANGKLQEEIRLAEFSSGVYILEVAVDNQSIHKKFIVAR